MLKPKEKENNKSEINDKIIPDNKNEIDKNINIINIDNENVLNELYNISEEDKIDKDDIPVSVPCSNSIFVDENNTDSKNEIDENNKNNYINESDKEEGKYLLEPVCSIIKENELDEMSNSENTNIIKDKENIDDNKDNRKENQIKDKNKDGISNDSYEDEKIKDSEEEKNQNKGDKKAYDLALASGAHRHFSPVMVKRTRGHTVAPHNNREPFVCPSVCF